MLHNVQERGPIYALSLDLAGHASIPDRHMDRRHCLKGLLAGVSGCCIQEEI